MRVGRDVVWMTAGIPADQLLLERAWRTLMTWTTLQVSPGGGLPSLQRTAAYESLERSEKGAVSFFLGQTAAMHVAEKLFGCVVFAHLDPALHHLGLPVQGSRPDFIGLRSNGSVILVEAKGRSAGDAAVLATAKEQVNALHLPAEMRYASLAYFTSGGRLRVTLLDPDGDEAGMVDPRPAIVSYYERLALLTTGRRALDDRRPSDEGLSVVLPGVGARVSVSAAVLRDAAALAANELSVGQFAARLATQHRLRPVLREALQSVSDERAESLIQGPPPRRREALAELRRVSRDAEQTRAIRHADGTLVQVDDRWSIEAMRRRPAERG